MKDAIAWWNFFRQPHPVLYFLLAWSVMSVMVGPRWGATPWQMGAALLVVVVTFKTTMGVFWALNHRRKLMVKGHKVTKLRAIWRYPVDYAAFEGKRSVLRRRWQGMCTELGWTAGVAKDVPRPYGWAEDGDGAMIFYVNPGTLHINQSKIIAAQGEMAGYFRWKVVEVKVKAVAGKPGTLQVTVYWKKPLARVIDASVLPANKRDRLVWLVQGIQLDGTPLYVSKRYSQLTGAMTGQGKSNDVHHFIGQLRCDGEPLWLYISDAKGGMELSMYSRHVMVDRNGLLVKWYAPDAKDTRAMLEQAVKDMQIRMKWLGKHGYRSWEDAIRAGEPMENMPRALVVVDEALLILKSIKEGADGDFGQLLTGGRAAGYTVLISTQDSRAETFPAEIRALIPTRRAYATDGADSTNVILGRGAEGKGARCSELDPNTDQGVFYAGGEDSRVYTMARCPRVTDAEIEIIVEGGVPPAFLAQGKTDVGPAAVVEKPLFVYIWRDNSPKWAAEYGTRPFYSGKTNDLDRRRGEHFAKDFGWCPVHHRKEFYFQVHGPDLTCEVIATEGGKRGNAAAEKKLIRYGLTPDGVFVGYPVFNKQFNNRAGKVTVQAKRRVGRVVWSQWLKVRRRKTSTEVESVVLEGEVIDAEPTNEELSRV